MPPVMKKWLNSLRADSDKNSWMRRHQAKSELQTVLSIKLIGNHCKIKGRLKSRV